MTTTTPKLHVFVRSTYIGTIPDTPSNRAKLENLFRIEFHDGTADIIGRKKPATT